MQLQLHVADLCKFFYGMGGGVRQSIGFKDIKRMLIAIPPINEQNEILMQVHEVNAPIDKQICRFKTIISELIELKNTIIANVVTGKIDIRNVAVPEYEHVDILTDEDIEGSDEAIESQTDGTAE
ncbi:hypothetical protein BA20089_07755 [Bifidobacterium asteroides DSM 20089]|uniref:Type I restriction modification DNA specificity domain-containing protein n=1 Tax=Bifidobacterium asteroides DSM 20089 TaxID=1437594 RepID=A0AAD0AAS2_9BIFI|nr:hypothetical protein [Bifidobacterium asteroides]ATO42018.1 hypothetical protein BA20089_07755 [Bifidobacterium asteroides DSM 20089]